MCESIQKVFRLFWVVLFTAQPTHHLVGFSCGPVGVVGCGGVVGATIRDKVHCLDSSENRRVVVIIIKCWHDNLARQSSGRQRVGGRTTSERTGEIIQGGKELLLLPLLQGRRWGMWALHCRHPGAQQSGILNHIAHKNNCVGIMVRN